jgi:hypothetical protein
MSADALWRKMFQRLIKFHDEDDPAFYKKMVSSVAKSVEVIFFNLTFNFETLNLFKTRNWIETGEAVPASGFR